MPWGEIVKGFEYAKGEFVVMTDDDITKARVEGSQAIEVRDALSAMARRRFSTALSPPAKGPRRASV